MREGSTDFGRVFLPDGKSEYLLAHHSLLTPIHEIEESQFAPIFEISLSGGYEKVAEISEFGIPPCVPCSPHANPRN